MIILISIITTSKVCYSQQSIPKIKSDTVSLKKGQYILINKKTYPIKNDTFFLIPQNVKYEIIDAKIEDFYNQLENKIHNHPFYQKLYDIILTHSNKVTNIDSFIAGYNSVLPYIMYSGQYIRKVEIRQLNVFGPTIQDTTREASSWFEKTANNLHFQSKLFLITNNLFFKKGDLLNPVTIADDERLLRALPYFDDAKIIVTLCRQFQGFCRCNCNYQRQLAGCF